MDTNQLWQAVLGELELSISKANFTTWFKGTYIISYENKKIIIAVPNTFTKAWLEKKFKKQIYEILQNVTSDNIKEIEYKVETKKTGSQQAEKPIRAENQNPTPPTDFSQPTQSYSMDPISEFSLNSKYTFDSFIVGKCNELANAAAKAVAEKPGYSYNPLFIYGGVGLGKTHLIQAIGNRIIQEKPNAKIFYVSCEKFTSDFVKAIKTKTINEFKNTYRKVDVLLMDDVQFLAGKEQTQEEFFHTFNELYQNNKQVAVTSDRPPKAIPALESRLLSRFEWGMIADISILDLETRMAILESKITEKTFDLDEESIEYIAKTIHNNVRELEGALNRINAYIELNQMSPSIENIKKILSSISTVPRQESVSPLKIINIIAVYYDVKIDEIMGKSREKRLVYPRQMAMYLLREEVRASFPAIGNEIGGRDHTTAMHACNKISNDLENDEKVRQDLNLIKQKLYH